MSTGGEALDRTFEAQDEDGQAVVISVYRRVINVRAMGGGGTARGRVSRMVLSDGTELTRVAKGEYHATDGRVFRSDAPDAP
jgi:hypothetical protein